MVRLEEGDSVMLHAMVARGETADHRIGLTKCATDLIAQARLLAHNTKDTWAAKILSAPPAFSTKIVSPSGRFTVHYNTSGGAAASDDYAKAIARFADEAYEVEIGQLGYVKPPYSNADSTYHIYLNQLGSVYGYTDEVQGGDLTPSPSGLRRTRTFMVIENDFLDSIFVTRGLEAARITVFHEFHHVVQFGSYGRSFSDLYFQEMTSTYMEMLSDSRVEDYIQYIPNYIRKLTLRFDKSPSNGYGQAIWLEYLASRFGRETLRTIWEDYRDVPNEPIISIARILVAKGSSFSCEYAKFGEELFFTGKRTRVRTPFANATHFPIEDLEVQHVAPGDAYGDIAFPTSLHLVTTGFGADSVVLAIARDTAMLTNASIVTAIISGPTSYSTVYSDPARFCEAFGQPQHTDAEVFPQPYVINSELSTQNSELSGVNILVATARLPVTTYLAIHSISMDEIIALQSPAEARAGGFYMNWNGLDAAGKLVPSGVYLYTSDADGEERRGKIVVIRK
jgi:hypothetical protein